MEGAGSLEDDVSALAFLLLEKKDDDDCAGIFGGFEMLEVIDPFLESPGWIVGVLSSLSCCLARKPKVPLEAIVAGGFAPHSNRLYWWLTWAISVLAGWRHGRRRCSIIFVKVCRKLVASPRANSSPEVLVPPVPIQRITGVSALGRTCDGVPLEAPRDLHVL